ncbi:MAG: hypothetical protein OEM05_16610 [Myxococcales bacterium]|nr:hypothetical protein [Myxococcales bacterium]
MKRPIRFRSPRLAVIFAALLVAVTFGMTADFQSSPGGQADLAVADAVMHAEAIFETQAGGSPPCMGFSIGDTCITPKALAECRQAVKKCGDGPVAVRLSCPLKFVCGG